MIEADKVNPNRLQDILFTGTRKKRDNYKFGPVVANSIKIWKTVVSRIGGPFKFCNSTPAGAQYVAVQLAVGLSDRETSGSTCRQ